MTLTLAHLSDIHLGPLPRFPARHWNIKRGLGFLNWHRNRKAAHLPSVLATLVADMQAQQPDHVAVTGDLVNIGLPEEYETALNWLRQLGSPHDVTVIPGNHDIYVRLGGDPGVGRWLAYMSARPVDHSPGQSVATPETLQFPFVRRLGRIALIGLNSAVPTPPFVAAGRLGLAQLTRLAAMLDQLAQEGLARVVLIHHPPLPGQAGRMKALRDAAALAEVIGRHGAELVLHGHNHRSQLRIHETPAGPLPVIGVPSASLGAPHNNETLARYHIYRFETLGSSLEVTHIARGLSTAGGQVVELDRQMLTLPRCNPDTRSAGVPAG